MQIKDLWLKFKNGSLQNNALFSVVLFSVLVLVAIKMLFPTSLFGSDPEPISTGIIATETSSSDWRKLEEELEKDLSAFLSQVRNSGYVDVMISLEHDGLQERAIDIDLTTTQTEEVDSDGGSRTINEVRETQQTVQDSISGQTRTVWLSKKAPQIRGVIVVAEGAANSEVKARLSDAVRTYFNIPAYKICVLVR